MKLYIGNLPESCQVSALTGLFEKYGKVAECDIVKNYGFVHMDDEDEAKMAIDNIHNTEFMGTKITVEASHSKVRQRPGMGGKGQCYRCGRQGHWSKECPRNPSARGSSMPPMMGPRSFMDRGFGPDRGMDRGYGGERSFGMDRGGYGGGPDRMRPYPDPYERRAPGPPSNSGGSRDDYFSYYRRSNYDDGYNGYGGGRRSPPRFMNSYDRFDFSDDRPSFNRGSSYSGGGGGGGGVGWNSRPDMMGNSGLQ